MFDLLRKKIQQFTQKIVGNADENTATPAPETPTAVIEEKKEEISAPPIVSTPAETKKEEKIVEMEPSPSVAVPVGQAKPTPTPAAAPLAKPIPAPAPKPTPTPAPTALPEMKQDEAREMKARVGLGQQITGFFTGNIALKEETVSTFLEEFELSLLEADVNVNTANALIEKLHERLTAKNVPRGKDPTQFILEEIRHALRELIDVPALDFDARVEEHNPCVILILGPNGAGKTTSIAKLVNYLQQRGRKTILASADTFRAGSIEQLQVHADKLGTRLIRHNYGSDPAAVAFDAVKAAKAEDAQVVIIDTAGRQDTNKNLLEELKKINRVIQPHMKLYVGESYTGQAILAQVQTFDAAIGIDGFILTKLDTDAKGGGVVSILHELHKPIVFFGVGQTYDDLIKFDLDAFLERIIPSTHA